MKWPRGRFAKARRVRRVPGKMNKTERAYADQLDLAVHAGQIRGWLYEPLSFRLADRTSYCPDFLVFELDDSLTVTEVKGGFMRDDGIVKLKVAAELYPWIRWRLAQYKNRTWTIKEIGRVDDDTDE